MNSIEIGLSLVLNHLLSPNGDLRPGSDAVVRLFGWIVHKDHEFNNERYIKRVIHAGGFDPDYEHDE